MFHGFGHYLRCALRLVILPAFPLFADTETVTDVGVLLSSGSDVHAIAGELKAYVLFALPAVPDAWVFRPRDVPSGAKEQAELMDLWRAHPAIEHAEWQTPREHERRDAPVVPGRLQWHLANSGQAGGRHTADIHATGAFELGWSGSGVVVAIVDDGLDSAHSAFSGRYREDLALNLQDGPASDGSARSADDNHGTAVAGLAVAGQGNPCGPGVAYNADLTSIRLISATTTDILESSALGHRRDVIDIFNCSWGPDQTNGLRLAPMGFFTRQSLLNSITEGRAGKGNIFVWASGNSGEAGANVNYDGYANSRYTIAVGAVDRTGLHSPWSVPGAALMVVAPSGDYSAGVVTTDRTGAAGFAPGDCHSFFTGTSASAPMVTGVVALMLEANPGLRWRDVQHILALTAVINDPTDAGWITNTAGFRFNDKYGFGRVDATAAVQLASVWHPLPAELTRTYPRSALNQPIPDNGHPIESQILVAEDLRLEHVEVVFRSTHTDWGQLEIELHRPSGIYSRLLNARQDRNRQYSEWRFMTLRHWGESASGTWTLRVRDTVSGVTGNIKDWELILHGTAANAASAPIKTVHSFDIVPQAFPRTLDPGSLVPILQNRRWLAARAAFGEVLWEGDDEILVYSPEWNREGPDELLLQLIDSANNVHQLYLEINYQSPPLRFQTATFTPPATGEPEPVDWVLPAGYQWEVVHRPDHGWLRAGTEQEHGSWLPFAEYSGSDAFAFAAQSAQGYPVHSFWEVNIAESPDAVTSLTFSNASQGVDLGRVLPGAASAFTLSAWIRPQEWGDVGRSGYGRIFDKEFFSLFVCGPDNIYYPEGSLVLFLQHPNETESAATTSAQSIRIGEWQHVAVSYDGVQTVTFYIDGLKALTHAAQQIPLSSGALKWHGDHSLILGNNSLLRRPFIGSMARPAVWNRVLSDAEVEAVFTEADADDAADAWVGQWLFAEGAGDVILNRRGDIDGRLLGGFRELAEPPLDRDAVFFAGWNSAAGKIYYSDSGYAIHARHYPYLRLESSGWCYAPSFGETYFWALDLEGEDQEWMAVLRADDRLRFFASSGEWYQIYRDSGGDRLRRRISDQKVEAW